MEDEAIIALYWKRDQEAIRQTELPIRNPLAAVVLLHFV